MHSGFKSRQLTTRSKLILVMLALIASLTPILASKTVANTVPVPSVQSDLYSIEMRNATDGWIVGQDGIILRWNGLQWRRVAPPPGFIVELGDVSLVGTDDVWVVGSMLVGEVGTHLAIILRWNGSGWEHISSPQPELSGYHTITMLSSTDGWIAGNGPTIHWNGTTWVQDHRVTRAWSSAALSPTEVWFGYYDVKRYTGTDWVAQDTKGVLPFDLLFLSERDGWAVGNEFTFCDENNHCIMNGVSARWDGTGWTRVPPPYRIAEMRAVSGNAAIGVWATGSIIDTNSQVNGLIFRWNGTGWTEMSVLPGTAVGDLAMVSATDGWAIGMDGLILRWNGTTWSPYQPTTVQETYIPMISDL